VPKNRHNRFAQFFIEFAQIGALLRMCLSARLTDATLRSANAVYYADSQSHREDGKNRAIAAAT
jgi:hypothetical protein